MEKAPNNVMVTILKGILNERLKYGNISGATGFGNIKPMVLRLMIEREANEPDGMIRIIRGTGAGHHPAFKPEPRLEITEAGFRYLYELGEWF